MAACKPFGRSHHRAIYGLWDHDPERNRLQTRFELVEFLWEAGERKLGLADLLELAEDAPDDPELRVRIGRLLLAAEVPVGDARRHLRSRALSRCLVRRGPGEWSWISAEQLDAADGDVPLNLAVPLSVAPRVYPDQPVDSALRLLGKHEVLPVVSRAEPDNLVGALTLEDVHRAYGI